jgi:hypothetical protein
MTHAELPRDITRTDTVVGELHDPLTHNIRQRTTCKWVGEKRIKDNELKLVI